MIPEDRTYTRNHEWVKLDGAVVQMGLTAPILKKLGVLVSLEMPSAEDEMMLDVHLGAVESMTAVHEILSPADATILAANKDLEWDLDALSADPYEGGWLLKIKVHNPDQLRSLLTAEAYQDYCREQWQEEFKLG